MNNLKKHYCISNLDLWGGDITSAPFTFKNLKESLQAAVAYINGDTTKAATIYCSDPSTHLMYRKVLS